MPAPIKPPKPSTLPAPPPTATPLDETGAPIVDNARSGVLRVNRETQGRRFLWGYAQRAALDTSAAPVADEALVAAARRQLGADPGAPWRVSPDGAVFAVWLAGGDPTEEPVFPIPAPAVKTWAIVATSELEKVGRLQDDTNLFRLALAHFQAPISADVRQGERHMAVWLHDGPPEGDPIWPG